MQPTPIGPETRQRRPSRKQKSEHLLIPHPDLPATGSPHFWLAA